MQHGGHAWVPAGRFAPFTMVHHHMHPAPPCNMFYNTANHQVPVPMQPHTPIEHIMPIPSPPSAEPAPPAESAIVVGSEEEGSEDDFCEIADLSLIHI